MDSDFIGAKLALFLGEALVVILRDDKPDIPWPAHWDLPGGGREGGESPLDCALRETREELGLRVPPASVQWAKRFTGDGGATWFLVGHLPANAVDQIRFGNEGQRWELMLPRDYMKHPLRIPHFGDRVGLYLSGAAGDPFERPPARGGGR